MESVRRTKKGPEPRGGGDRDSISAMLPTTQRAIYQMRARELGIPFSSWLAKTLAEHEGLEVPDYVLDEIAKANEKAKQQKARRAEELDFPKSA